MKIYKAYKYRLKASPEHISLFIKQAGCCRFVWNKALEIQKKRLDSGDGILRYVEMSKLLTGWKREHETAFLADASSPTMQQSLIFLDRAIKDAFNKKSQKRFPRFKKKGRCTDSFRYTQSFKLMGNTIYLPKIGWVKFIKSREIHGSPKNVTVSRRGEHWYVSILN